MSPNVPPRNKSIDFLRAISILWIVGFWHILDYFPSYQGRKAEMLSLITIAALGLFALISGFLMGQRNVPIDRSTLSEFYLRRFGRVYPPFLLATFAFWIMHMSPPASLAKGALLVAMWWGPPPFTLWFMVMIVQFYALTPFLLALRRNIPGYCAVFAVIIAAILIMHRNGLPVDTRLAMYIPPYATGMLIANRDMRWLTIAWTSAVVSIPAAIIALTVLPDDLEHSGLALPWVASVALLIFAVAMHFRGGFPVWRWIAVLAEASFFLYLFHRVVYVIILKSVQPTTDAGVATLLFAVGLPLAISLSLFGQRLYEQTWRLLIIRVRQTH